LLAGIINRLSSKVYSSQRLSTRQPVEFSGWWRRWCLSCLARRVALSGKRLAWKY